MQFYYEVCAKLVFFRKERLAYDHLKALCIATSSSLQVVIFSEPCDITHWFDECIFYLMMNMPPGKHHLWTKMAES